MPPLGNSSHLLQVPLGPFLLHVPRTLQLTRMYTISLIPLGRFSFPAPPGIPPTFTELIPGLRWSAAKLAKLRSVFPPEFELVATILLKGSRSAPFTEEPGRFMYLS